MEKQKKSVGTIALVVLLLIVTIVSLVLATYAWAKYTTNANNTASANVAKWNVAVSLDNSHFTSTYSHVLPTRLAPGTQGQLDATVTIGSDTEVDVDYKIYIEEVSVAFVNTPADNTLVPHIPTNMKFANAAGTDITAAVKALENQGSKARESGVEIAGGRVAYNAGTGVAISKALTWSWAYETGNEIDNVAHIYEGDAADTADGENPVSITIKYRVDAWQVQPTNP